MIYKKDNSKIHEIWCRLFPEFRYFESRADVRKAESAFMTTDQARIPGWPRVVLTFAIFWGAGETPTVVILTDIPLLLGLLVNLLVNGGASVAVVFLTLKYILYRPYVRYLRWYLQNNGVAICLQCGYDLRGQTEPRCPECGLAFDASLLEQRDACVSQTDSNSVC